MTIAIFAAAILAFCLGYIWYAPKVFGSAWQEAIGGKSGDAQESLAKYIVSFVGWLAAAFVYAFLISHGFLEGIRDYLFLSIALWGAYMLPAKAQAIMFGNFSTKLLWIDGGYMLAGYIVFAFVFRLFGA
jgi:hypothetical protein